jgi:hypothetical protein
MTAEAVLKEMLFLPDEDKATSREYNYKLSKGYLTAYKQYAEDEGYKLKRLNFTIVAPSFSNSAYQTAYFFNNEIKNMAGVNIKINLVTIEEFVNILLSLIPDSKWYIRTQIPSICLAEAKVLKLVEQGVATII